MEMDDKALKVLIEKYYEGKTSSDEEKSLYSALSDRKGLKEFEAEWTLFQLLDQNSKAEVSDDFDIRLEQKLALLCVKPTERKLNRFSLIGVAASLLLLLSFYLILDRGWLNGDKQIIATVEMERVDLPDGSVVWLIENSTLKHPQIFDPEARHIILRGEGFFDVVADKNKPFIVETEQVFIEVLGTSFNVKSNSIQESTEVAVRSGVVSVLIKTDENNNSVRLTENEIGTFSSKENAASKGRIRNPDYFARKMGKKELTGNQLLVNALDRLPQNYANDSLLIKGFFRETVFNNDKAVFLTEAAVNIYDRGFSFMEEDNGLPTEEVYLHEVRKSNNYSPKEIRTNLNQFNSLTGVLKWNRVRYFDNELEERIEANKYHLDSVVEVNGNSTYVIGFVQSDEHSTYEDRYFIDMKGLAIKRYEKSSIAKAGFYLKNQFRLEEDTTYSFKLKEEVTFYEFEEFGGKMYLINAGGHGLADIINTITNESWELGIDRSLAIDVNSQPFKNTRWMDPNLSLELQIGNYNADFWADYELNYTYSLDRKIVNDLEWEVSLMDQFLRNLAVPQ